MSSPFAGVFRFLRVIVRSFLPLQESGLVLELVFGQEKKIVHCYFPVALWLGDIKSQDMLAGRQMTHRKGCPRLGWQCLCDFEDMDNPDATCAVFPASEYRSMVVNSEKITVYDPERDGFFGGDSSLESREAFRELYLSGERSEEGDPDDPPVRPERIMSSGRFSRYLTNLSDKGCVPVDSVLNEIDWGDSPAGQFGALGVDILHSLLGGVIKYVCTGFIQGFNSKMKEVFDDTADSIFLGQWCSEHKYLRRMNFTHGSTNLSFKTCREWVGLMLTFVIVSQSVTGSANLDNMAKKTNAEVQRAVARHRSECQRAGENIDNDSDVDPSQSFYPTDENGDLMACVDGSDFIEVAEAILAFFSYVNRRSFWRKGDTDAERRFKESCATLLDLIKAKCPRNTGKPHLSVQYPTFWNLGHSVIVALR